MVTSQTDRALLTGNWLKKVPALLMLASLALVQQTGHGQGTGEPPQPMKFFQNYFITGDYKAAGIGLQGQGVDGIATGNIEISDVPDDAEIIAAFLYWQVVTSDGPDSGSLTASFNGQLLSAPGPPELPTPGGPIAVVGDPFGTSPCWSSGGGTGASGGVKKTYTYRVDAMRFLRVDENEFIPGTTTPNPQFGKFIINGAHEIKLPDSGNSNNTPRALGASLVVIYRDPKPLTPLNAIVIYDGSYTLNNATSAMSLDVKGFYDPYPVAGQITHIAGSGQDNKTENLIVPGNSTAIVNPFVSGDGASWDTVTRPTGVITGDTATTSVSASSGSSDCLTWSAVIYRQRVNDGDNDGLLNIWESSTTTLLDPRGEPLPNLKTMGASATQKDLFLEIASMKTNAALNYGTVAKPIHDHLPTYEALKKVGKAFYDQGIVLHVDVGNNYQGLPFNAANPVHIVPVADGARGGESFDENITKFSSFVQTSPGVFQATGTACTPDAEDGPWVCQFGQFPGTVGWKIGYRLLRDMPYFATGAATPANPSVVECEAAEEDGSATTRCDRVFDRNRKDMFHFILFAHSIGIPKESCIGADGFPDFVCMEGDSTHAANPLFHEPATNTGVSDILGGDGMVTLGGFNDALGRPVGTDYMQAGTLAHELGHSLGLLHGAVQIAGPDQLIDVAPGCKPNYLSVMNYLFQLRGLIPNSGVPTVDFSGQTLHDLQENSLTERGLREAASPFGAPKYRTGWYAPKEFVAVGTPATKYCDGSPLSTADQTDLTRPDGLGGMVRVDTLSILGTTHPNLDWDYAGAVSALDINFDGSKTDLHKGFNDWSNIRLNQVGSRRNIGAWFWIENPDPDEGEPLYFAFMGGLSGGVTAGDLSASDLGKGGLGKGGLGKGGLGAGDLNLGDLGGPDGLGKGGLGKGGLGKGGLGKGGLGKGGLGKGGLGKGGLGIEGDETDIDIYAASGFSPATELKAFVRGTDGAGGTNSSMPVGETWQPETTTCAVLTPVNCHRIRLDWKLSNAGPSPYRILREIQGTAAVDITSMGYTQVTPGVFRFFDTDELPAGTVTYTVVAQFTFEGTTIESPTSATLVAVNEKPTADADAAVTDEDKYVDIAVLADDQDVDTVNGNLRVAAISNVVGGNAELQADGRTVRFTPTANANDLNTPGGFSFSYTANSGTFGTLSRSADSDAVAGTITVNFVNDPPAGTDNTALSVRKGSTLILPASAFGFSDPVDIPANTFFKLKITTLPSSTSGTLKLNGATVTVGMLVTKADLDANKLTFTARNGNPPPGVFTFQVQDNGGTLRGGVDLDQSANTIRITITN